MHETTQKGINFAQHCQNDKIIDLAFVLLSVFSSFWNARHQQHKLDLQYHIHVVKSKISNATLNIK
jgi:hypothetical protein